MRPLKILFADVYYPRFIDDFQSHHRLDRQNYSSRFKGLNQRLFATSDFYPRIWSELGHISEHIIINAPFLQKKWASDRHLRESSLSDLIVPHIPLLRGSYRNSWETDIFREQVKRFKPDVLFIMDPNYLPLEFLWEIKKLTKLMVSQIASPLKNEEQYKHFDLIFSSLPNLIEELSGWGVDSHYVRLAFDSRVLDTFKSKPTRIYGVTFIGGLTSSHTGRIELLNQLGQQLKLDFFGYGKKFLQPALKFVTFYGEVWGKDMYLKLLQSRMTLNKHIDVAGPYANNMRLFEATGCGTLLFTDNKKNLGDLFVPDKEVVVFDSTEELVDKIRFYLKYPQLAIKIAKAGQRRTLREHTYTNRLKKIIRIIKSRL